MPVLQISMPMHMSEESLYELGGKLAPLRDEGVFILATGNLVHDLRDADLSQDVAPEYAVEFDRWVAAEHYRPLFVAAGAARNDTARFPVEGFEHGTIARRCVQLD